MSNFEVPWHTAHILLLDLHAENSSTKYTYAVDTKTFFYVIHYLH